MREIKRQFKVGDKLYCLWRNRPYEARVDMITTEEDGGGNRVKYLFTLSQPGSDVAVMADDSECSLLSETIQELSEKVNEELDKMSADCKENTAIDKFMEEHDGWHPRSMSPDMCHFNNRPIFSDDGWSGWSGSSTEDVKVCPTTDESLADKIYDLDDEELGDEEHRYRMYVLVEKHLSTMNKGIQAAHAVADYCRKYRGEEDLEQWLDVDNTLVVLDGGTARDLVKEMRCLLDTGAEVGMFYENDLDCMLTAISFIADERVYDNARDKMTVTSYVNGDDGVFTDCARLCSDEEFEEKLGGKENVAKYAVINGRHLAR